MKKLNTKKNINKPEIPGKVKKGYRIYVMAVLALTLTMSMGVTAFAAGDPITVVNNLSDFIFGLIRAVGLILLGWGIVQVGLSFRPTIPASVPTVSDPGRRCRHHLCKGNPQPHRRLIRFPKRAVAKTAPKGGVMNVG